MKRLAFYTLIIAITLALLVLMWQFRSVAILLILSLVLTAALRPSVDFLEDRGLRAGLARALVYLLVFGLLGLGLYLIINPLLAELQLLSNYLVILYDSTYRAWSTGTEMQQGLIARLPAPDQLDEMLAGPAGAAVFRVLFGVTQNLATLAAGVVVVLVLSLYWSADRSHFERLWLSLLPANQRIQARSIWQTTERTMGAYVRSEFVQSFLAVVVLAAGYAIIGLDYPLLAGLLAGLAWLIPLVGFIFAALASFLLGLIGGGVLPAVGALAFTIAVLAFLEFVVEPRLFRRSDFSGILIILVIAVLVDAYGLTGFVIAPPLAVALQVLGGHIIKAIRQPPTTAIQIDTLGERLAAVRAQYDPGQVGEDEVLPLPPEVANLMDRLEDLIGESRQVVLQD